MINVAKMILPENSRQAFDQGVQTLRKYAQDHKVASKEDARRALRDLNISNDFLSKIGGLVQNNPIVSKIASVFNVDQDKILKDIEQLNQNPSGGGQDLEAYKRDLEKLMR